jgi:hypothetical protein
MFALRARVVALVVALFMALPAGAFARGLYFCRSMDRVMEDCCCGTDTSIAPASRGAELQRTDCCQLLRPALQGGVPATQARNAAAAPPPLVTILPELVAMPLRAVRRVPGRTRTERARGSPSLGPPVYLKHCVLLT